MKIFYDTEFLEDGNTIELISIGMVTDDGREYYAVCEEVAVDPLHHRIAEQPWLMENVVPHLPLVPVSDFLSTCVVLPEGNKSGAYKLDLDDSRVLPKRVIAKQVRDFIQQFSKVELWAYYAAYDHVALAQLWGRMIDLPAGIPMWTNDIQQERVRLGNPDLPENDESEHNALADAKWNLKAYNSLKRQESSL